MKFPAEWKGGPETSPAVFGAAPTTRRVIVSVYECQTCRMQFPANTWTPGHTCPLDASPVVKAGSKSKEEVVVAPKLPEEQLWKNIIRPFLNVAAGDRRAVQALLDCKKKLDVLDPQTGLGVLHGLVMAGDFVELLQQFLELGVDVETNFLPIRLVRLPPSFPFL